MKKSNGQLVLAEELNKIEPLTENQKKAFEYWDQGFNLVLNGSAGTGKTFLGLYFALKTLLEEGNHEKVMIMRSVVPTREIGFLQGSLSEKTEPFLKPYKSMCDEIFGYKGVYNKLVNSGKLDFEITSHIRGCTFDNVIIVIDEMQNLNGHELDSVITRAGENCRLIFAGDKKQSDFKYQDEKDGVFKFLSILERMRFFRRVDFEWADIVRS